MIELQFMAYQKQSMKINSETESPQSRNKLSFQSEYHKRNRWALRKYLVQSFGYTLTLADVVVSIHDCTDLPEMMNLFILDDSNKYQHYFIPDNENSESVCQICEESESMHSRSITWKYLEDLQGEMEKEKEEKEENLGSEQTMKKQRSLSEEPTMKKRLSKRYQSLLSEENSSNSSSILEQVEQILCPRQSSLIKEEKPAPRVSQKQSSQIKYCQLCYEVKQDHKFVIINEIHHEICLDCMNEYLKEEILNLRIQGLSCPHCGLGLSDEVIQGLVSHSVFEKYQTFQRNIEIQKNPHLRWCPNPKCSIVLQMKKRSKTGTCPKCGIKICAKCNREAHPKKSCDAMMRKQLEGLENAKDIQKCKKCQALVEKISGCNHMTCTVCSYQWCWLCGATYSSMHFKSLNPFGCAGMQDANFQNMSKCRIFFTRFLIVFGFIVIMPIILPLFMIGFGPAILINSCDDRYGYRHGCLWKLLVYFQLIIVGIIINPFMWVGLLFLGFYRLPQLCSDLCYYFRQRRQIHENSQNFIRRRLLLGDDDVILAE